MLIIDGRKAQAAERARLKERAGKLPLRPSLALVQVGDLRESSVYIAQKLAFATKVDCEATHIKLPDDASFEALKAVIEQKNADASVDGIIVQLPLPAHLDKDAVINLIDPKKDVDGLTDESQRLLAEGKPRFAPATAKGIMTLLRFYGIDVKGRTACVLGRSKLVGSPTAKLLALAGAEVSVCHSQTPNAAEIAKRADILVCAVGKPTLVGNSYIREGAVVIDVGITSVPGIGLVGDVDRTAVDGHVSAITPVPGGVGPMTVLSLFDNLIASAEERLRS